MSATVLAPPATTRAIAEAATTVSVIEPGGSYQARSEVALSQALFALDRDRALHAATFVSEVRQFALENVVLDADSLLLFQDGLLIPESDYFAPPEAARSGVGDGDPAPDAGETDYILGYNRVHWGYQHWLTQTLPAIDWAMRQPRTRPAGLVLPELAPWQEDLLRLLGYADVPRLTPEPGTRIRFGRLAFSEYLIGAHNFGISFKLRETAARILQRLPPAPSSDRILYVPGALAYYGGLCNEDAAIDLLRRRGVRVIEPDLPTADRINLFRHAQVVIGPLGAGLSDVVFCRPGTLMWEWMPVHHKNVMFNRLAQAAEVDYLGDVFPSTVTGGAFGAWNVDTALIDARLDAINERLARRSTPAGTALPPVASNGAPPAEAPASHDGRVAPGIRAAVRDAPVDLAEVDAPLPSQAGLAADPRPAAGSSSAETVADGMPEEAFPALRTLPAFEDGPLAADAAADVEAPRAHFTATRDRAAAARPDVAAPLPQVAEEPANRHAAQAEHVAAEGNADATRTGLAATRTVGAAGRSGIAVTRPDAVDAHDGSGGSTIDQDPSGLPANDETSAPAGAAPPRRRSLLSRMFGRRPPREPSQPAYAKHRKR